MGYQISTKGERAAVSLRVTLSSYWCAFQASLFPQIEQDLGPLDERYQFLIAVERVLPPARAGGGARSTTALRWPSSPRRCCISPPPVTWASACATTTHCGACAAGAVSGRCPASPPSRALRRVRRQGLAQPLARALIKDFMGDQLVGHVARDSTAIVGREKATPKPNPPNQPKRKRGRPRKGAAGAATGAATGSCGRSGAPGGCSDWC